MAESSVPRLLLASARQDEKAVAALSLVQDIGDAIVGFHAQQAVEKALKAVLSSAGVAFRRTHDIAELLDLLADSGLSAPPEAETLDELNPYAVEARYGLVDLSGLDRQKVRVTIAQVLAWAEERAE
jgi:HEPN domain-containing protein